MNNALIFSGYVPTNALILFSGYAYSQGLTESLIGGLMALGAITGIIGTFAFTRIRKRIGIERTGLIAFSAEIICLTLCVAAVWAPGSPFDPGYFLKSGSRISKNCTQEPTESHNISKRYISYPEEGISEGRHERYHDFVQNTQGNNYRLFKRSAQNVSYETSGMNLTAGILLVNDSRPQETGCADADSIYPTSKVSIALMMAGIISSRIGRYSASVGIIMLPLL